MNSYSEHDLGRVFREYGEDWRRWRVDAKAVVAARQQAPITTTCVHNLSAVSPQQRVSPQFTSNLPLVLMLEVSLTDCV